MGKRRRILAVVLTVVLTIGSICPVSAAEYPGSSAGETEAAAEVQEAEETAAEQVTGETDVDVLADDEADTEAAASEGDDAAGQSDEGLPDDAEQSGGTEAADETDADDDAADVSDTDEVLADEEIVYSGTEQADIEIPEEGLITFELAEQDAAPAEYLFDEDGALCQFTGEYSVKNGRQLPLYRKLERESFQEGAFGIFTAGSSVYAGASEEAKDYYYSMYNQLSENAKAIYDKLKKDNNQKGYTQFAEDTGATIKVNISGTYNNEEEVLSVVRPAFRAAIAALDMDDQNAFWLNRSALAYGWSSADYGSSDGIDIVLHLSPDYATMLESCYGDWDAVQKEIEAMEVTRTDIERGISNGYSFYEKIQAINDYIVDYNYYNRYVADGGKGDRKAYLSSSALTKQEWLKSASDKGDQASPVCEGYARAFKMICDGIGIPCILVCGDAVTSVVGGKEQTGRHMWNYVQDADTGLWYGVDATWNDPLRDDEWNTPTTPESVRHNYLLVGSDTVDPNPKVSGRTFLQVHHPNGSVVDGGTPFEVPALAETALKSDQYTVIFDAGEGQTDKEYIQVKAGDPLGELPTATRRNYRFLGWFLTESGSGDPVTADYRCEGTIKLYARWEMLDKAAAPEADILSGTEVEKGTVVKLTTATEGAVIYYTLDGSSPLDEDNKERKTYAAEGIVIEGTVTILATAMKEGFADSDVSEFVYTLKKTPAPVADPPTNTSVEPGAKVTLSCELQAAVIQYTLDRTSPADKNNKAVKTYTEPIEINKPTTITAIALYDKYESSDVVEFSYRLQAKEDEWGDTNTALTEEELGEAGISSPSDIPDDLWVVGVNEANYTGKGVTFSGMKVFCGNKRLSAKDYSVKYKNNKNAYELKPGDAGFDASKAPAVTITGKGNLAGKVVQYFTIHPIDLAGMDAEVSVPAVVTYANGRQQKKTTTVSCIVNGKRTNLKKGRDITFAYGELTTDDLGNVTEEPLAEGAFKDPGTYTVTVLGKAPNFIGSCTFDVEIREKVPGAKNISSLSISVSSLKLGGDSYEPKVTVKDGGKKLVAGEHYDIAFDIPDSVGTGYATIEGIEDAGYYGRKVVKFKVTGISLGSAKIRIDEEGPFIYSGSPIEPAVKVYKKIWDPDFGEYYEEDFGDYDVTYRSNIKKGTATVVCKGTGIYSGSLKKTFKIQAFDISDTESGRITVEPIEPVAYQKGGVKPAVVVRDGDTVLKNGVDYKLAYADNAGVTENAKVTISGKGNYKGSKTETFRITPASVEDMRVFVADIVEGTTLKKAPAVTVTDLNGKKLNAGTDYEVTGYKYLEGEKKGQEFDYQSADLKYGDELGTVIKGLGNYEGSERSGYVDFRCVKYDISKAKVEVYPQIYTGSQIKPRREDMKVSFARDGGIIGLDAPEDYMFLPDGYGKNIAKGKGTLTIHGVGEFGGTKKVTFMIKAKSVSSFLVKFEKNAEDATGEMKPCTLAAGDSLPARRFERTGYRFVAWSTTEDGRGNSYIDKEEFQWKDIFKIVLFGGEITLYAQWELEPNS